MAFVVVVVIAGFMAFVSYIITIFPFIEVNSVVSVGNELLKYGLAFVPAECWATFISTVVMFGGVKFSWAIIEWIYKKIPGVD